MPSIPSDGDATPCSTTIHRPFGNVTGYRRLTDRASRVSVDAFPIRMVQQLHSSGLLSTPGAYILSGGRTCYLGESKRPGRRVYEHSIDPTKRFAENVYVISGCNGAAFDKPLVLELQLRLTRAALDAGQVTVHKAQNPAELDFQDAERASHDRIYSDAMRLLFDAGCRIFESAPPLPAIGAPTEAVETNSEAADEGPMQIGVTTTPLGASEFELQYADLWARAYWSDGHFIVAAGSEVRTTTNGSVNALTRTRREELFRSGVLAEIPGIVDRRRLVAAVAFPSSSIAAKCLAGAHTVSGWSPLSRSRAVVLAA